MIEGLKWKHKETHFHSKQLIIQLVLKPSITSDKDNNLRFCNSALYHNTAEYVYGFCKRILRSFMFMCRYFKSISFENLS